MQDLCRNPDCGTRCARKSCIYNGACVQKVLILEKFTVLIYNFCVFSFETGKYPAFSKETF